MMASQKTFFSFSFLFLFFFSFFTLLSTGVALAGERQDITPQQAQKLLQTEKNIFLLDVRTPWEYRRGAIKDAHLIPISRFRERESEIPMDRPILVYCAVGGRSLPVADYLARKGVTTYNLRDGIVAWQRAGLPVIDPNQSNKKK